MKHKFDPESLKQRISALAHEMADLRIRLIQAQNLAAKHQSQAEGLRYEVSRIAHDLDAAIQQAGADAAE